MALLVLPCVHIAYTTRSIATLWDPNTGRRYTSPIQCLRFCKTGIFTTHSDREVPGLTRIESKVTHRAWKGLDVNKPPFLVCERDNGFFWRVDPVCHLDSGKVLTLDEKGTTKIDGVVLPGLSFSSVDEVYPGILRGSPLEAAVPFFALPGLPGLPRETFFDERGTILHLSFSTKRSYVTRVGTCCLVKDASLILWFPETGRHLPATRPSPSMWKGCEASASAMLVADEPPTVLWYRNRKKTGFLTYPGSSEECRKVLVPGKPFSYQGLINDGYPLLGTENEYFLYDFTKQGVIRPLVRSCTYGYSLKGGVIVQHRQCSVTVSLVRKEGNVTVARLATDPEAERRLCFTSVGILPTEGVREKVRKVFSELLIGDLARLVGKYY